MKLINLVVRLVDYGEYKGTYQGKATFSNDVGEVQINLMDKHCQEIFRTYADSIIEVSQEVASHLTANIIEHKKSITDV